MSRSGSTRMLSSFDNLQTLQVSACSAAAPSSVHAVSSDSNTAWHRHATVKQKQSCSDQKSLLQRLTLLTLPQKPATLRGAVDCEARQMRVLHCHGRLAHRPSCVQAGSDAQSEGSPPGVPVTAERAHSASTCEPFTAVNVRVRCLSQLKLEQDRSRP